MDQQIEKNYHPENFEKPCGKCGGYKDDHDEDGKCIDDASVKLTRIGIQFGRVGAQVDFWMKGLVTEEQALCRIRDIYLEAVKKDGDTVLFKNQI